MADLIHLLASIFFMLTFTTPTLSSNNVLYSSLHKDSLGKGQALTYKDYALTLQEDCDLVLTGPNHTLIWRSETVREPGSSCNLTLGSNGLLNLYGSDSEDILWSSGVNQTEDDDSVLVLHKDGNLKIFGKSIWSSSLKQIISDNFRGSVEPSGISEDAESTFWSGDTPKAGTIIVKDNYQLELGTTCNMTLKNTSSNRVLWHTNTSDPQGDCLVKLKGNGELNINYPSGLAIWSTYKTGPYWGEYVLVINPKGVLTIFGPVIWVFDEDKAKIAMHANHLVAYA